jgi:hypothetical protein
MLTVISQRFSGREMSVREKGLWAQALKALDDARLRGSGWRADRRWSLR